MKRTDALLAVKEWGSELPNALLIDREGNVSSVPVQDVNDAIHFPDIVNGKPAVRVYRLKRIVEVIERIPVYYLDETLID